MFDEKQTPGNLPADIFEGIDRETPAMPPAPISPSLPAEDLPQPLLRKEGGTVPPFEQGADAASLPIKRGHGVLKAMFIIIFAAGIIAAALYFAYRIMNGKAGGGVVTSVPDSGVETTAPGTTSTTPDAKGESPAPETAAPAVDPNTLVDSDGDGLTNAEEIAAGTSITKPDTDGDGLGDREEVKVYGTDPLRVDTDSDGFTDGQEVANGYNPNGTGRLFSVPGTK